MPGTGELVGIVIAVLVIWFVLKLARVAIRLIVFIVGLMLLVGVLYYVFMR
ncbi:MAG TPA: hypothetical protein VFL80_10465 [Thermoanaerobaculia bacterium]|nr:hypothetical protein [Thermoanaerobaculia bacterium]